MKGRNNSLSADIYIYIYMSNLYQPIFIWKRYKITNIVSGQCWLIYNTAD